MKILMLTDRMDAGGAETHVASLALALRALGEEVTVLSAGGRIADRLEAAGVRCIRTAPFTRSPLRLLLIRRHLCHLLRGEHFDILHAHARLPALLLRTLPRRVRAARAVTVHAAFRTTPLSRRLSYWGEHTLAVSEDLRLYLYEKYAIPYGRIRVIPNGIDCTHFCPRPGAPGGEAGTRLLFASRLDADCALGAHLLLALLPRLARRVPALTATIAGGGDALEEVRARAEHCNRLIGREAVLLIGHVEDMAPVYAAHTIFIGVSRAAMEAAACGCAVILCGNEGFLGVLDGDAAEAACACNLTCRHAPTATEEALERALLALLTSSAYRRRAAAFGQSLVRARFALSDTARQTLACYRAIVPSRDSPILIGGYYGCGNLGDDTILAAVHRTLANDFPTLRLSALTAHPRQTARDKGIFAVSRRSPLAIRTAMRTSRAFLCGGGSLLQNKTSNRSLSYYLWLLHLAHRLGVPPILYAAGIGPLLGARAQARVAETLALCRRISLRDADSRALLSSIGVEAPLHLGADPAFLYPHPSPMLGELLLTRLGMPPHGYFCLLLKGGEDHAALLGAAAELCKRSGLAPLLLVMDRSRDRSVSLAAARRLGAPCLIPDTDELLALLSRAALVLSERLHGCILGVSAATPTVVLATADPDPKLSAFAHEFGLPLCSIHAPAALLHAALSLHRSADAVRASLLRRRDDARKKAKKDLENMVRMLYNIDSIN